MTDVTPCSDSNDELYSTIFSNAPVGIVVSDPATGLISAANYAFHAMLGYADGSLIGANVLDLTHPDFRPNVISKMQSIIAGQDQGSDLEKLLLRRDGSALWVRSSVTLLPLTAGRRPALIIVQDISARKAAEAALRDSEQNYRMLMAHASDAIFVAAPDLCFLDVNSRACDLLGYSRAELLELSVTDILVPGTIGRLAEMRRGEIAVSQGLMRRKDGGLLLTESSVQMLPDGRFQGIVRDIGERRQAEAALNDSELRFRAIFESSLAAIFIFDDTGRTADLNPAAGAMAGRARADLLGRPFTDFVPASAHDAIRRWLILLLRHGELAGEAPLLNDDGSVSFFQYSARAHFLPGYHLVILDDITERRRAEEKRTALLAAEETGRAKSRFLSRMSHELRTPLNAILGFAQLLDMDELATRDRESVDHILLGGRHLLDLVDEVLDITSIEQGRLAFNIETVPLDALLREAAAAIAPEAAQHDLSLQVHAPTHAFSVRADRVRLKQVLLSLLSNAVNYNQPGGSITLSCGLAPEASANEPGRLRIIVRDSGYGIAPAQLPHLFEPFERLDAEKLGIAGTGLGLVTARLLTEAMGGTIGVESRPTVGSTFWVELPQPGGIGDLEAVARGRLTD